MHLLARDEESEKTEDDSQAEQLEEENQETENVHIINRTISSILKNCI